MSVNNEEKTQQAQLMTLVREAIESDEALRIKFEVGDKFRFIRDRLKELITQLELDQAALTILQKDASVGIQENEIIVYVYLFNTKGIILRNWINMLSPKVFYEYSVNRPIYANRTEIEAMLRTKKDKPQHAYLAVAVQKTDILTEQDALVKVREGALKLNRLMGFYHNGNEYTWSADEGFVKKT